MRALAVFHDHQSYHWANKWLRPGFWHVFVVLQDVQGYWISIDARDCCPCIEIVGDRHHDMIKLYHQQGFTVVELELLPTPLPYFILGNCIGVVKAVLGIRAWHIMTPYRLYRWLLQPKRSRSMIAWARLPGKSVAEPVKNIVTAPFKAFAGPDIPDKPKEVAAPPTVAGASVASAAVTARQDEQRRRGRRATVLTSGTGVADPLGTVNRPIARAAELLGRIGG